MQRPGYGAIDSVAKEVLAIIEAKGGEIEVGDKSSPETIQHVFGISKKTFKKAIGSLYREKIITIEPNSIKLV